MVTGKPLVFIKSKHDSCMMILSCIVVAMLISLSQYILRSRNDLIDEVDFETLFIYWYALVIINLHSGMWSLLCEASLKSSTALRRHFQEHLLGRKETSSRIVDYQKAWLSLSAIYRQTGEAVCYPLLLNILSHFILLVCSVYGLLSASLQGKFGAIELSLLVNIVWSCLVLYSMCNNAHKATVEVSSLDT
ncbi:unnamed protein product [Timema podura]|uniref:Gustatory receptor n=1 Tax=Timema podura TaxID=61482 RepID=A0ABN7P8L2_TIMPD|nr:unnamed protein product [Timema podura]